MPEPVNHALPTGIGAHFDSLSVTTGFGEYGQKSAKKMYKALSSHSLSITFNDITQKFTVWGSASLSKKALDQLFAEKTYEMWSPKVLIETDILGNHLVKFVANNILSCNLPTPTLSVTTIAKCSFKGGVPSLVERDFYSFIRFCK